MVGIGVPISSPQHPSSISSTSGPVRPPATSHQAPAICSTHKLCQNTDTIDCAKHTTRTSNITEQTTVKLACYHKKILINISLCRFISKSIESANTKAVTNCVETRASLHSCSHHLPSIIYNSFIILAQLSTKTVTQLCRRAAPVIHDWDGIVSVSRYA